MCKKNVIFYPLVTSANFLLGYFSRLYMVAAVYTLLDCVGTRTRMPRWFVQLEGVLMLLLWLIVFLVMNFFFSYVAKKKNPLAFYLTEMFISAGGFLTAFII